MLAPWAQPNWLCLVWNLQESLEVPQVSRFPLLRGLGRKIFRHDRVRVHAGVHIAGLGDHRICEKRGLSRGPLRREIHLLGHFGCQRILLLLQVMLQRGRLQRHVGLCVLLLLNLAVPARDGRVLRVRLSGKRGLERRQQRRRRRGRRTGPSAGP